MVRGHRPSTCQWSHTVNEVMRERPWELLEPRSGTCTPTGGAVRKNFLEEAALQEGAPLHLQLCNSLPASSVLCHHAGRPWCWPETILESLALGKGI